MATIRKRGESWRVEIAKKGIRKSATFSTKTEATKWALFIESQMRGNIRLCLR